MHRQRNVGLEQMPAYLPCGSLKVLFAIMGSAGRRVERRRLRVRRLPCQHAEDPCEHPAMPAGDVLGVVLGEPVVTTEKLSIEQADRLQRGLAAMPLRR